MHAVRVGGMFIIISIMALLFARSIIPFKLAFVERIQGSLTTSKRQDCWGPLTVGPLKAEPRLLSPFLALRGQASHFCFPWRPALSSASSSASLSCAWFSAACQLWLSAFVPIPQFPEHESRRGHLFLSPKWVSGSVIWSSPYSFWALYSALVKMKWCWIMTVT